MDTFDQQIAYRTDRGLLYLMMGLIGFLLLIGLAAGALFAAKQHTA